MHEIVLQIVTSALYSISVKSIFARAVVGSRCIVTDSINATAVCAVGTLVNIYHNKKVPVEYLYRNDNCY